MTYSSGFVLCNIVTKLLMCTMSMLAKVSLKIQFTGKQFVISTKAPLLCPISVPIT
jgi:hypothetical protein